MESSLRTEQTPPSTRELAVEFTLSQALLQGLLRFVPTAEMPRPLSTPLAAADASLTIIRQPHTVVPSKLLVGPMEQVVLTMVELEPFMLLSMALVLEH